MHNHSGYWVINLYLSLQIFIISTDTNIMATLFSALRPWTLWVLKMARKLSLDAELKLTHPDADCALRVSQDWKGSAENHKRPKRTSDCCAIILPSLSCTWKEKQRLYLHHSV